MRTTTTILIAVGIITFLVVITTLSSYVIGGNL